MSAFLIIMKRLIPVFILAAFMIYVFPHVPGSPLACLQHGRTCSTPDQMNWLGCTFCSLLIVAALVIGRRLPGEHK